MSSAKQSAFEQKLTKLISEIFGLESLSQPTEVQKKELQLLIAKFKELEKENPALTSVITNRVVEKLEAKSGSKSAEPSKD